MNNFRDSEDKLIVDEILLRKNLPNQMDKEYAEKIKSASQAAGGLVGAGFSFTAVINLAVGHKMNEMLGSVKNLQLIVHLTLMHVLVPANAQVLMTAIFEYVTFDLFDTSALTASYYAPTEVEVSDSLEQLGYESAFCLINLGSCFYFIFGQLIYLLLSAFSLVIFRLKCW